MAVNPYTLNSLYQKGILDFVPTDLCYSLPAGNMNMQNPYLNSAMQGNLYQQYGTSGDTFTSTNFQGGYYNTQIGAQSNTVQNAMHGGFSGYGSQNSNGIMSMFGFNGTGSQSDAGVSMFGQTGIGGQSNINMQNTYGGFSDVSNGINNVTGKVASMPTNLKGLIAAGLITLALFGLFRGRGNKKTTQSFWS
ncbi:hypothetical protein IKQ21_07225, partial [bacterium]|nr:hypothetical protein [bacterium]